MIEGANKMDWMFKALSLMCTIILFPTFKWAWETQTHVQTIRIELAHTQKDVEEMQSNALDIELLKRDIEYINTRLTQIRDLITQED